MPIVIKKPLILLLAGLVALAHSSCQRDRPDEVDDAMSCGCSSPVVASVTTGVGTLLLQGDKLSVETTAGFLGLKDTQLGSSDLLLPVCSPNATTDSLRAAGVSSIRVAFGGDIRRRCLAAGEGTTAPAYTLSLTGLKVTGRTGPSDPLPTVSWLTSCNDPQPIAMTAIPNVGQCSYASLAVGKQRNVVIQSQSVFEQEFGADFVRCGLPLPKIDFTQYTLLIGSLQTPQAASIVGQRVVACPDGSYTYSVEVGKGLAAVIDRALYHVLIPKVSSSTSITFDVRVQP